MNGWVECTVHGWFGVQEGVVGARLRVGACDFQGYLVTGRHRHRQSVAANYADRVINRQPLSALLLDFRRYLIELGGWYCQIRKSVRIWTRI